MAKSRTNLRPTSYRGTEKYVEGAFYSLRIGLLSQFIAILGLIVFHFIGGGGLFNYTLIGSAQPIHNSTLFRISSSILQFTYLVGACYISAFQLLMSDDAAWARGFRSGSKLVSYATSLDICSSIIQFILFFHLSVDYSPTTWSGFSDGGSEWLLCAYARLLHSIACLFYAFGFLLVEVFHDEGTSAFLGAAILMAYIAAAVTEVLSLVNHTFVFYPLISLAAVGIAFVWSVPYENELYLSSPHLHETELTNEIEAQANQYAILSPEF